MTRTPDPTMHATSRRRFARSLTGVWLALCALAAACASPQPRPARGVGHPEIFVADIEAGRLRSLLVAAFEAENWDLVGERATRLSFEEHVGLVQTARALSNENGKPVPLRLVCALEPTAGGFWIVAALENPGRDAVRAFNDARIRATLERVRGHARRTPEKP